VNDGFVKPPGHTCPDIDRAQSAFRKLAWRIRRMRDGCVDADLTQQLRGEVTALVAEGEAALERVREANTQMRAAHAAATTENERLRALLRAQETS